jgi:UDP-2-acetamido-3-amino-2,3-dideoxy-glucuronate N-acetyltransferase
VSVVVRTYIHPTAEVSPRARIGPGTRVWHYAQIREEAQIGDECILGRNTYIDAGVVIGARVKIQSNVSVFHGVAIEDEVFIGPHVCFTNDELPRAVTPEGALKGAADWILGRTLVCRGASIGAGSIVLPNVTIGRYAMVGAGSVVTRPVPSHALVYGNPARVRGYVCVCAQRLVNVHHRAGGIEGECPACGRHIATSEVNDRGA